MTSDKLVSKIGQKQIVVFEATDIGQCENMNYFLQSKGLEVDEVHTSAVATSGHAMGFLHWKIKNYITIVYHMTEITVGEKNA